MAEHVQPPLNSTLCHPRRTRPSSLFQLIPKQERWRVALHLSLQVVYWGSLRPRLNWTALRSLAWTAPPLIAHLSWISYRVGQERLFEEQLREESKRLAKITSGPDQERIAELLKGAELLGEQPLVEIEEAFRALVSQEVEEKKTKEREERKREWLQDCIESLKESPEAARQQLIDRLKGGDLDQIEKEYEQLAAIPPLLAKLDELFYTSRLIERLKESRLSYRERGELFNLRWFQDGLLFAPKSCLEPYNPTIQRLLSDELASPQERAVYQMQRRRDEVEIRVRQLNRISEKDRAHLRQCKDPDEVERGCQWLIHVQRAIEQLFSISYNSPLVGALWKHLAAYYRGGEFHLYWFQQSLSLAPKSYFYPGHPTISKLVGGEPLSFGEGAGSEKEDLREWTSKLDQLPQPIRDGLINRLEGGDLDSLEQEYRVLFLIQKALTNLNTIQYTSSLVEMLKDHRAAYYGGAPFNLDWFQDSLLFASTSYHSPHHPTVIRLLNRETLTPEERLYYKRQATSLL